MNKWIKLALLAMTAMTAWGQGNKIDISVDSSYTICDNLKTWDVTATCIYTDSCGNTYSATQSGSGKTKSEAESAAKKDLCKAAIAKSVSNGTSITDNMSYNHIHDATDYAPASLQGQGCSPCGGANDTLSGGISLGLMRFHRFRNMTEMSSFGPGIFSNFDVSVSLFDAGGEPALELFDPSGLYKKRFYWNASKKYFTDSLDSIDYALLLDDQGVQTDDWTQAKSVKVINLDQSYHSYDLFDVDDSQKFGRYTGLTDSLGYSLSVTYQHAADSEVDYAMKWMRNSITDSANRTVNFTYLLTQKKGRWVVSQVDLPNNSSIMYSYEDGADGALNAVSYPDGTSSSFQYTNNAETGDVEVHYFEAGAKGIHRKKTSTLSNNVSHLVDYTQKSGIQLFNQASLLAKKVQNGQDEIVWKVYPQGSNRRFIYEGGHKMKYISNSYAKFMLNWDFDEENNKMSGLLEDTYSDANTTAGRPSQVTSKTGVITNYLYNTKNNVTRKKYSDNTYERYEYDGFQNATRLEDRLGRVTRQSFDPNTGLILSKELGYQMSTAGAQGVAGLEVPGFNFKYYEADIETVSDLNSLEPVLEGQASKVSNVFREMGNDIAFIFSGQLNLENAGDYTFAIDCFDMAFLKINGVEILRNDTEARDIIEQTISLEAGKHDIEFQYLDKSGGTYISLKFKGPDTSDQLVHLDDDFTTHLVSENSRVEVQTNDYASYNYEYYPAGHSNANLLRYEWDANGNKTEYIYNADHQLTQILEPHDSGNGTINAKTFTYDSAKRLKTSTDPLGRVTTYDYDSRDRVVKINYNDGSFEEKIYGTGVDANHLMATIDRNTNKTTFAYDEAGRKIKTVMAADTVNAIEKICSYLTGTELIESCVTNGEKVDYVYDYRHRLVQTINYPNNESTLIQAKSYLDNKLFCTSDSYGRKTYNYYRPEDAKLVRTVKGLVPSFELAGYQAIIDLSRDLSNNATYLITDYELDDFGQTIATIDPRGIRTEMQYDLRGRMIASTEAIGTPVQASTSREYDANSNVTASIDPRGIRTEMTYTARNLMSSQTVAASTPVAATSYYTYYDDKRQNTVTDYKGNFSQSIWHQCCGRPQASIDQAGNGTITNNDFYGNITHLAAVEDVAAHAGTYHDPINAKTLTETTRLYDSRNRMVAQTVWLQPLGYVDPNNVPIATDSAQGLTTFYTYFDEVTGHPELASIIAELAADGITLGSNNDGSAVMVQNPAGELSVQISDGLGRSVASAILEPSNYSVITWNTTAYDVISANGLVETASIDALNNTTKSRADGAGRVFESVDALGNVSTASYDANSNRVSYRDASGVGEDCTFDARNRDVSCVDTAGSTTTKVFDANNNLLSVTDSKGKNSTYIYDLRNRKISQTDRIGGTTTFAYDANNNLTSITDAQASVTSYIYDLRNLQTSTIYPPGSAGGSTTVSTVYDALGRKTQVTDQLGDTVTYTYDMVSRMLNRDYSDNTSDTFTYDDASRLVSATKGRYSNTISYTYDQAGRRLSETQAHNGESFTISHTFDVANRVTSCTYPDGTVLNKTYTDRNLLEGLSYAGTAGGSPASVVDFSYDASMREASRKYGNAITATRTYNNDNTLLSLTTSNLSPVTFSYTYDANKNVTDETVGLGALGWTAAFDNEDRLSMWTRGSGYTGTQGANSPAMAMAWNLDLIGNWSSVTRNGLTDTRTHNGVHELTTVDGAALAYDAKGNLTTNKYGSTLTWDIDNHLQSILYSGMDPADAPSYEYDALGRRLSKTVAGYKTLYVLCDQKVCAEYFANLDDNPPTFILDKKYVWGTYVDELIAIIPAEGISNILYAHQDRQYNLRGLTDASGALVEYYAYSPYGERTAYDSNGTEVDQTAVELKTEYGFTGRRYDMESDLWYFRARYFDTEMGRFVSRDPLGYVDGFGLYNAYFAQLFEMDPSGYNRTTKAKTKLQKRRERLRKKRKKKSPKPPKKYPKTKKPGVSIDDLPKNKVPKGKWWKKIVPSLPMDPVCLLEASGVAEKCDKKANKEFDKCLNSNQPPGLCHEILMIDVGTCASKFAIDALSCMLPCPVPW